VFAGAAPPVPLPLLVPPVGGEVEEPEAPVMALGGAGSSWLLQLSGSEAKLRTEKRPTCLANRMIGGPFTRELAVWYPTIELRPVGVAK
jgi:hypothetical protein